MTVHRYARPLMAGACLLLSLAGHAATAPSPAWAHRDGIVNLEANGVRLANDNLRGRLMIQEAFARWGIGYDEARVDVVRSLFTADAVFEVLLGNAKPIARAVGIEDIIRNVSGALQQQSDQRRHAITNVVIDRLTKTEATAMAYGVVTVAADGLSLGATVIYSADLRRERDGVWRFSRFVIGMDDYAGRRIVNPQ